MANKSKWKQRDRAALTPVELQARIHKALREGRSQQALELARSLFKQDPSPDHLQLVQQATLERARQLRTSGYIRDAGSVLENAIDLGGADFLKQVAEELARCGETRRAMTLSERIDDAGLRGRIVCQGADAAMRQGAPGRSLLPEAQREQFDLIRTAFSQAEAGQDEAARATLQGVGLQSPFLEWKLLVRGFLAYYRNDDVRALENWQRLDIDRLPARLAAPFRFLIDAGFRQAQAPATQNQLQKAADHLQGSVLVAQLRPLQSALANEKQLAQAFRLAENLLPALRQQAPHLVPRLASCFYWTIINHGNPEDTNRYLRVFGPPADDPSLFRMQALALEHRNILECAHTAWQDFEKWLAQTPAWGPGAQRQRARALIWSHMGQYADGPSSLVEELPPFLRRLAPRPNPLEPSAEACYKKSLALAPDNLETHEALFRHYREKQQTAKAIKAGRGLLVRFPDHVPTLEALGDMCHEQGDYDEALRFYQHAMQVNPLEKRLRSKVATTHLYHGRVLAESGAFGPARAEYQASMALEDPSQKPMVLCKWAGAELKAGQTGRAEELIQQARQEGGHPAVVAYYLVIEALRFKLPAPLKARFAEEFTRALDEPASAEAAVEVVDIAVSHKLAKVKYVGQKTHEKKALAYVEKALPLDWTEDQLEKTVKRLMNLKAQKLLKKCIKRGQKTFPTSPIFYLQEAESILSQGRPGSLWQVNDLLDRALSLAQALPRNDRQHKLLKEIHDLQDLARTFGSPPPFNMFGEIFNEMFGDEDEFF